MQFQWVAKSVRIGLKYSDTDFDVDSPYLNISSSANTAEMVGKAYRQVIGSE